MILFEMKIKMLIRFLFLILIIITISFATDNKTIFMVLWRGETEAEKGFKDYLNSTGTNIKYVVRNCEKKESNIHKILSEIKSVKPDLIYTFGTTVTTLVAGTYDNRQVITEDIPIIFNIVSDPFKAEITLSDTVSGRNLTGASHTVPLAAQIKAIKKMMEIDKIGFIYNGSEKNSIYQKEGILKCSQNDSFEVAFLDVKDNLQKDSLLVFIEREKPSLIYLPSDSYLISNATTLIKILNDINMPVFSATEGPVRDAGALFGLVSRYYNVGQLAGYKASQILYNNIPSSEIKIENLKRFSFIVNIKTAKKIGLIPPLSIMAFAEIIE